MIPEYQHTYSEDGVFGEFIYGGPGVSRGFLHSLYLIQGGALKFDGLLKVLVIGAGNGYELINFKQHGHDVTGIDLYVPDIPAVQALSVKGDASNMPFEDNSFDLAFCCETFEHIPHEICLKILGEIQRTCGHFYFTIATRGDEPFNTHINVKPAYRWMDVFDCMGFEIVHAEMNPTLGIMYKGNGLVKVSFRDGVLLYGSCNKDDGEDGEGRNLESDCGASEQKGCNCPPGPRCECGQGGCSDDCSGG